jgi:hypothetical protein
LDSVTCGDLGDILPWTSPHWSFTSRISQLAKKRTVERDIVCGKAPAPLVVTIPVVTTFRRAVEICRLLGNGQVTAYYSMEEWLPALKQAQADIGDQLQYLWFSIVRRNGTYVSYYTNETVKNVIWRPSSPSGENDCMYCQDHGCADRNCEDRELPYFQCKFSRRQTLVLRGLCPGTKLSSLYYPHNQLGQFLWVGIDGTIISYNSSNWVAKVQGKNTWATAEASRDSLLLGTHEWTVYNDPGCFAAQTKRVKLSLSFCQSTEFNCGDGSCVPLELRCDENVDCGDGSDEEGCKIVNFPASYNKDVTSNNLKSALNTTIEIQNILNIDENQGKIRLSMRVTMGWFDSRLEFFNLKENSGLNVLDEAEFSAIWKPKIIFLNMERKNFEAPVPEQIMVPMDPSRSYHLADYDSLNSSKIYNGSSNAIYLTKEFR